MERWSPRTPLTLWEIKSALALARHPATAALMLTRRSDGEENRERRKTSVAVGNRDFFSFKYLDSYLPLVKIVPIESFDPSGSEHSNLYVFKCHRLRSSSSCSDG